MERSNKNLEPVLMLANAAAGNRACPEIWIIPLQAVLQGYSIPDGFEKYT